MPSHFAISFRPGENISIGCAINIHTMLLLDWNDFVRLTVNWQRFMNFIYFERLSNMTEQFFFLFRLLNRGMLNGCRMMLKTSSNKDTKQWSRWWNLTMHKWKMRCFELETIENGGERNTQLPNSMEYFYELFEERADEKKKQKKHSERAWWARMGVKYCYRKIKLNDVSIVNGVCNKHCTRISRTRTQIYRWELYTLMADELFDGGLLFSYWQLIYTRYSRLCVEYNTSSQEFFFASLFLESHLKI